MNTFPWPILVTLALAMFVPAHAGEPQSPYLDVVLTYADTLLEKGRDNYGPKKTALWCGVINLEDFSVPQDPKDVPMLKGFRAQDRAVGGCNLHQDVSSLRTFLVLSTITGDVRYEKAVRDYVRDYFAVAQNPKSGLLAWGEHMYYEVHGDVVHKDYGRAGPSHELVEYTPPWDILWAVDPAATRRAIDGLKYHFFAEAPAKTGWLFNRHANWNGGYNTPAKSMPWIKHAGLYAYSYSFLHRMTREQQWQDRAVGIGDLYWNQRNPTTDLSAVCLPVPGGLAGHLEAAMTSSPLFTYFLLKSAHVDPAYATARDHALTMLKAFEHLSWDPSTKSYREVFNPDGSAHVETDPKKIPKAGDPGPSPWSIGYGSSGSGLLRFGRALAYAARTEKDETCRDAAVRVAAILQRSPLPAIFTAEEIGFGIHLNLDVYGLTTDKAYLAEAGRLAKIAFEKLSYRGMFRAAPGAGFYEAKLGAGDLASALLRLSLRLDNKPDPEGAHDWSF